MSMKGKRLLLLGGTNSWEEIKEFSVKNHITLIATGPYSDTILKRISDEAYDVDAMDEEALYHLIVEKNIDGVFVGCNENVVPHAIAATERAGKPCYCNTKQWNYCANKSMFKDMCKKYGIPVTKEYSVKHPDEIEYPVITKPADSCGSQGFSICNNKEELDDGYRKALPFSRTKNVLVEKYMPYDAVIIHYTLVDGEIIFSGMSDKQSMKLKDYGSSVMALQLFPSAYTKQYLESLNDKVIHMFQCEGMHDGPIWIEAFNNNGEFTFNEMGYRFGGSMTYYPIRYFYGMDQLEMMLRYSLLGESQKKKSVQFINEFEKKDMKYSILPLHVNPGTIQEILGEQEIKGLENLYAYVPIHFSGDLIKQTGTVNQVFCYLHILYHTFEDLKKTVHQVLDKLSVRGVNGEEMLFCLYDINSLYEKKSASSSVLMLSQEDLLDAGCFSPNDAYETTKKALLAYDKGEVLYPDKICQIFDEETQSRINGLPATLLNEKICGIKWISVFPQNPQRFGVPNVSATVLLSEIETGRPLAMMDGTLCSNLRTATVGAVAASYFARKGAETIGFIGAGEQAKMHFITFKNVCPSLKVCKVASRTRESEQKFVDALAALYPDVSFVQCDGVYQMAAEQSDIIVTAISGQEPLLKAEWIGEGTFYCHVGGLEDEEGVALHADKIVCDNWNMVKHRSQTISRLYQKKVLKDDDIYGDLHEIVSGKKMGRENEKEFIYFNSVGLSFVDIALAYEMYLKCLCAEVGTRMDMQEKGIFEHNLILDKKKNIFVRDPEGK